MATANFHNRVARLHAKYDANPTPKAEMAPHIEDVERALAAKAKTTRQRFKGARYIGLLMIFAIGFAVPVFVRVAVFHIFPEPGSAAAQASLLFGILSEVRLDIVGPLLLMVLLILNGRWLPVIAYAAGCYLALSYEANVMALFPEIWANLYSPSYVADVLSGARSLPKTF